MTANCCPAIVVQVKENTVIQYQDGFNYNNSEDVIQKIASVAIGGHRVVKAISATAVDYADNSVLNDSTQVLGLTINAANAGEPILIRTWGEIEEPTWNWSQGWVWLDHNGLLTQTPPTLPSTFSMIIGQALSATVMRVLLLNPITL